MLMQTRALETEDILREIFNHLNSLSDGRTLANLALVCKDFCDAALDVLWQHLESVMPLLKLLEKSMRSERLYAYQSATSAPTLDNDWMRFLAYARRVHILCLLHIAESVRPKDLMFLARHSGDRPIFPSLVSLELSSNSSTAEMLLLLVTGVIRPSDEMTVLASSTQTKPPLFSLSPTQLLRRHVHPLAPQTSSLRELTVSGALSSLLPEIIVQFSRLEKLDVESCGVSAPILSALADMKALRYLRLSVGAAKVVVPYTFGSLESLNITGRPSKLACFFKGLSAPLLHTVKVEVNYFFDVWLPCRAFIDALSMELSSSLRVLAIKCFYVVDKPCARVIDALAPLLQVRGLESLDVNVRVPLSLTSVDVHDMAAAWTHLESLTLAYDDKHNVDAPSIFSLSAFALHCPRLHTLAIPRVVSQAAILESDIVAGPSSQTLTSLSFKYYPTEPVAVEKMNIFQMAVFIYHTFPNSPNKNSTRRSVTYAFIGLQQGVHMLMSRIRLEVSRAMRGLPPPPLPARPVVQTKLVLLDNLFDMVVTRPVRMRTISTTLGKIYPIFI
ncbi:hypothetical protein BKA93DRAFT_828475 [Sparassis latifolia]